MKHHHGSKPFEIPKTAETLKISSHHIYRRFQKFGGNGSHLKFGAWPTPINIPCP